jgi:hypothetical protein
MSLTAPLDPPIPRQLFTEDSVELRPWPDELIDTLGHDPRSRYVEDFWLGTLGPSTTWLVRRIAATFDLHPDGFALPLAETARSLGLGDKGGRHSPFVRALVRLCQFDLARVSSGDATGPGGLDVRRKLPPLNRRQVLRLSPALRQAHDRWQESQLADGEADRIPHRARQLALSLIELGEDAANVEGQLLHWRFHPALASAATTWAWERHRTAAAAAAALAPTTDSPESGPSASGRIDLVARASELHHQV